MSWSVSYESDSKEVLVHEITKQLDSARDMYKGNVEGRSIDAIKALVLDAVEDFTFPPPYGVQVWTSGVGGGVQAKAVKIHAYGSRSYGDATHELSGSFEIKYV